MGKLTVGDWIYLGMFFVMFVMIIDIAYNQSKLTKALPLEKSNQTKA